MKKLIVLYFLLTGMCAVAQKSVEALINAEKNFAAYSVANSVRDAFIKFLDSTGIVFEQGQPVNGIEAWNKKEKRPGILNWHPQFAEIAASNDFGYTTGPWTFQPKTITDSIVARGQYTTVWQLGKNGDWKFLVDLGVNNLPGTDTAEVIRINASKIASAADLRSLTLAEESFIEAFKKNKVSAYKQFLSQQSIVNRNGSLPAISSTVQSKTIEMTPQNMSFMINDSGIASSGDLGFVYGTITLNNKKENYLHIWRKEKEGWKIAVEVLRY